MTLAPRFPLGLLALLLAGCASPISPDEVRSLLAAERRWAARGFQDYRFETRSYCFDCPASTVGWVRVDVVGGQAVRFQYVESGDTIPTDLKSSYRTIEMLFHTLKTTDYDWPDDVVLEFDAQLGYPTRVTWVERGFATDGGASVDLRAAGPIPAP